MIRPKGMIHNVRHAGIVVADLDAAIDFYTQLLGLQVIRRMEEGGEYLAALLGLPDVRMTSVKLGLPATAPGEATKAVLELLYFHQPVARDAERRINDLGPTHVAFTVADVDELYRRLKSHNIETISPPLLSEDGAVKLLFGRTPDGTYLEFVEEL